MTLICSTFQPPWRHYNGNIWQFLSYIVASRGVLTVLNRCTTIWYEHISLRTRKNPPIRYTQNAARDNGLKSDHVLKEHSINGLEYRHYNDIIMGAMASQITSLTTVYSNICPRSDQRKHQLAFVRGIHRSPVNSPHAGPVTRKMLPFDDVIMFK